MKKGTVLITAGLLMIVSAAGLVGYNLLQSYQAGERSSAILEELQEDVEDASAGENADGASGNGEDSAAQNEADSSASASASGTVSNGTLTGGSAGEGSSGTAASAAAAGTDESTADVIAAMYPEIDMPTCSVNEITYLGWINIPSLSLTLPVQSEWQYDLLDISPARYSGSVYSDDLIIGGHSYITHFRGLRNIAIGANVILTDAEGNVYNYQVAWTESLNPNQGEALVTSESDQWDLTLFTCNTGGGSRCVVRCVRV